MIATQNSWREAYIRILTKGPLPPESLSDEDRQEQRELVCELIDDGFLKGNAHRDGADVSLGYVVTGTSVKGRLLAEKLISDKEESSFRTKLKIGSIAVFSWIAGVLADFIAEGVSRL